MAPLRRPLGTLHDPRPASHATPLSFLSLLQGFAWRKAVTIDQRKPGNRDSPSGHARRNPRDSDRRLHILRAYRRNAECPRPNFCERGISGTATRRTDCVREAAAPLLDLSIASGLDPRHAFQ